MPVMFPTKTNKELRRFTLRFESFKRAQRTLVPSPKGGTLAPKLKGLIGLGAALAGQRDHEFVETCVIECLRVGATRNEIMEVLRQAILMAEIPAETHTRIVRDSVEAFESQF